MSTAAQSMKDTIGASVTQFRESVAGNVQTRIRDYSTAVTVGVFIGAALTTGICAGVAGWWALHKSSIFSFISSATETVVSAATNVTTKNALQGEGGGRSLANSGHKESTIIARSTYMTIEEQQALHSSVIIIEELKERVTAIEARLRNPEVGQGSGTEVAL